jgi:lysophospholipase L1-like esterase
MISMSRFVVANFAFSLLISGLFLCITGCDTQKGAKPQYPRLAKFVRTLEQGGHVKIAFLGGSITWGATATDPMKTSYRALVTQYLTTKYPNAHIESIDAAIGGQPSKLGVFRMDHDVLPYKPDLVFVEFAVNDGDVADGPETIEGIVRKLHKVVPDSEVVIVIIGSGGEYNCSAHDTQAKLAEYYGLPIADVFKGIQERVKTGLVAKDILTDGCHPNDKGYRIYADIIIEDLKRQVQLKGEGKPYPEKPMTTNRYESAYMIELSRLPDLGGWRPATPSVVGTWFDHQPSRWHSSAVEPAKDGAVLATDVECSGVGLYYEITPDGNTAQLMADGKKVFDADMKNACQQERVMYQFAMLDGMKKRHVELIATNAVKVKAAYLFCTK